MSRGFINQALECKASSTKPKNPTIHRRFDTNRLSVIPPSKAEQEALSPSDQGLRRPRPHAEHTRRPRWSDNDSAAATRTDHTETRAAAAAALSSWSCSRLDCRAGWERRGLRPAAGSVASPHGQPVPAAAQRVSRAAVALPPSPGAGFAGTHVLHLTSHNNEPHQSWYLTPVVPTQPQRDPSSAKGLQPQRPPTAP